MAKYTLDNDFDFDFDLVAISCREKSHKMAWLLNTELKTNFKRSENHSIIHKKKSQNHAIFEYIDIKTDATFFLIKNNTENGYLANEQKAIDYFILINQAINNNITEIIKKIRNINSVLLVTELNILELKSKQNFIL